MTLGDFFGDGADLGLAIGQFFDGLFGGPKAKASDPPDDE